MKKDDLCCKEQEAVEKRLRDRLLFYVTLTVGIGFVAGSVATKLALRRAELRRPAAETLTKFGREMMRRAAAPLR